VVDAVPDLSDLADTGAPVFVGIARTRDVARYLQQIEAESLTREIDTALARAGQDDSSSAAVAAGRRPLAGGTPDW